MTTRVVACWIPDWPVHVAADAVQADAGVEPLAVVRRDEIVACSAPARAAGVRRRMRLRTALARCPGLRVSERDVEAEVRAFERVVRHLEQSVMPRLELIRPGLIVAPARGPARYWGGEEELVGRLVEAVAELGHDAQCGIADSIFAAALASRSGRIVPAGGDAGWLAPYPVGVLGLARHTDLLTRLGIGTVGEFAALPADKIAARFGADGQAAHRTARGLEARPLAVRSAAADHRVARDFDPAEVRLETLAFAARTLAEDLHQRLVAAGVVCARVEVCVQVGDGRSLSRLIRHEGRLSALAVADRVRGLLTAWHEDGVLGPAGGDGGITQLVLRPEALSAATGRQDALVGERLTPADVERAAARLQAMLGHQAVTQIALGGGRGPADRVERVPYGDVAAARRPEGPWPGQLPAPHPAQVFPTRQTALLADANGQPVGVSARLALSAPPARLSVAGSDSEVTGWAGPWPVWEHWWDRDLGQRLARVQVTTAAGQAWLLALLDGHWWAEALYG
ncbi:DNA polymerase Y family protein [Streptomyces sp. NBC_00470]|uniref:DNA polymerase Y family protein n=1 Tax=Streptomyces sp. NBC_00470 TaxID=2975753 RepID=UPI002F911170